MATAKKPTPVYTITSVVAKEKQAQHQRETAARLRAAGDPYAETVEKAAAALQQDVDDYRARRAANAKAKKKTGKKTTGKKATGSTPRRRTSGGGAV